jgi:hypothetical protein
MPRVKFFIFLKDRGSTIRVMRVVYAQELIKQNFCHVPQVAGIGTYIGYEKCLVVVGSLFIVVML